MNKIDTLRLKLNELMRDNFIIPERIPQYLYHYTSSLDSVKSIIETGNFWVSDIFTTTDNNEILHIRNIIKEILIEEYSLKESKMKYCLDFFDLICELLKKSVFILCFSVSKNSTHLWDSCASNGACLRFRFEDINHLVPKDLNDQYRYFADQKGNNIKENIFNINHLVSYDNDYKKDRALKYLELIYECIKDWPDYDLDEKQYKNELNLLNDIYTDLFLFSSFTKDHELNIEKEFRQIYLFPDLTKLDPILKTRIRENIQVRYVSINMMSSSTDRVYVPSKNYKDFKKSIKVSLKKIGNKANIKEYK